MAIRAPDGANKSINRKIAIILTAKFNRIMLKEIFAVECMVEVYMWAMKYRVAEISGILPIFHRILDSCQNRNNFSE